MIVLTITNSSLIPRSCGLQCLRYFQYANMRGRERRRGEGRRGGGGRGGGEEGGGEGRR